jgi:FMN phosphatase YigB (HAD superfamily)
MMEKIEMTVSPDDKPLIDRITLSIDSGQSTLFAIQAPAGDIKQLYFDFDGTLIDTLWIQQKAFKSTFSQLISLFAAQTHSVEPSVFIKQLIDEDFGSKRVISILESIVTYFLGNYPEDHVAALLKLMDSYHSHFSDDACEEILLELRRIHGSVLDPVAQKIIAVSLYLVYVELYEHEVQRILEKESNFSNLIYPGVFDFLERCAGHEIAIISGGSLSRVSGVVNRTKLENYFGNQIYSPSGVARLVKGARFKMDSLKELVKSHSKESALFIDDQAHVIQQAKELGINTLGIIHHVKDVERMLKVGPTFILTHDFTGLRDFVF